MTRRAPRIKAMNTQGISQRDSVESTALFGKFFVDGQWKVIEKKCSTCCYVRHFDKRPDEPSNMGCNKPGWEGYTFENDMACGGSFYFPNNRLGHTENRDTSTTHS